MGLIADAFDLVGQWLPERKVAVGASVPTWMQGTPQYPRESYYRYALEGYGRNEIVYACIEELATSAAEPGMMAKATTADGQEPLDDHPILDLLERPNPFLDRFAFWATVILHLNISGNAYIEKVHSSSGKVVELWLLRPDRMWVVPDARTYIRGYEYRIAEQVHYLGAGDVIHIRNRNPLDDYYGMPPLAVCAPRVDTDNWMRSFTGSFFRNAGVPAGMLNITKSVSPAERALIKDRFRNEVGGPAGWHSLLVLDNTEASYTAMGMALGERGLVLPELDEISESRIAMVFGVPLELIGARLGMVHGNRTTTKEARASFWDETLVPLYRMLAAALNTGLVPEFTGVDCVEFDLSSVRALQEDEDAKHTRIREDVKAGLLSVQEGRVALGREAEYEPDAVLMLPDNLSPVRADAMLAPPAPPAAPQGALPPGGGTNGHAGLSPGDVARLAALRAGTGGEG